MDDDHSEHEPDWASLATAANSGDDAAAREIVDRLYPQIAGRIFHMLPRREEVEDLAQEVFLRMFSRLGQYRGGAFRAWVDAIARRVCHDLLRKRRIRPEWCFADFPEDPPELSTPAASHEPEAAAAPPAIAAAACHRSPWQAAAECSRARHRGLSPPKDITPSNRRAGCPFGCHARRGEATQSAALRKGTAMPGGQNRRMRRPLMGITSTRWSSAARKVDPPPARPRKGNRWVRLATGRGDAGTAPSVAAAGERIGIEEAVAGDRETRKDAIVENAFQRITNTIEIGLQVPQQAVSSNR